MLETFRGIIILLRKDYGTYQRINQECLREEPGHQGNQTELLLVSFVRMKELRHLKALDACACGFEKKGKIRT